MNMICKPDLEKVTERFEAWWNCEIVDRPLVSIDVTPPPGPPLLKKRYDSLRERWMDTDFILDQFETSLRGRVFLAETIPIFCPNLGPEIVSTLFGAELEFGETTSWSKPVAASCFDLLKCEPDFDNRYWAWICRATDLSLQRGAGQWLTAVTDLHTNGDLAASLRTPQNLCMDLAEDLDGVAAAVERVTDYFPAIYDDLWSRIRAAGQPSTTWLPSLHTGRSYALSCDFICMISPAMFERAILPSIVREMRFLERSLFHLDGPGALCHLDALLACPELNGVQWVYGAGNGPAARWVPVYQRIQTAHKCMMILCEDIGDAEAILPQLRPEGVWLSVGGSYPLDVAQDFIRRIGEWGAHRPG